MYDAQPFAVDAGVSAVLIDFRPDRIEAPDQQDPQVFEVTHRGQRPVHDVARRLVAPHRVNGDPDHRGSRFRVPGSSAGSRTENRNLELWNLEPGTCDLFFFDRADLAPAIVAAVRADTVRQLWLMALRALG